MTITADSKKGLVIPWAKPGDVFACERQDENHFSLTRLNLPPPKKMTKAQVRKAIKAKQLLFCKFIFHLRWCGGFSSSW